MLHVRRSDRPRRPRVVWLLAAAACAAALAPGSALADDVGSTAHRTFVLESSTGPVADVADWSMTENSAVIGWWENGQANQQWEFVRMSLLGETLYRIKSRHSGLCLGTRNGSTTAQMDCDPGTTTLWRVTKLRSGHSLENYAWKGRYLDRSQQFGAPLALGWYADEWILQETKLAYSVETSGKSVSWGQVASEDGYCDEGWHVELDSGSVNPRYNYTGERDMTSVRGEAYTWDGGTGTYRHLGDASAGGSSDARRITMTYYNVKLPLKSRSGRVRYYCQPG